MAGKNIAARPASWRVLYVDSAGRNHVSTMKSQAKVDALASGPARLVAIDRPLLRRLMAADVGWAELLLRSLGRQLAGTLDIIDAERRLGSADRLERLLRTMAAEASDGVSVQATQQQLADLLGVSRVTLGAALRALVSRGLVETGYGRIRLLGVE